MKKYYAIIFGIITITLSLLLILLPKEQFSENENRYLSDFPEFSFNNLITGNFVKDFESYIQDHFAYRIFFLNLKTYAELSIFNKDENNSIYFAENNYLIEKNNAINYSEYDRLITVFNRFKQQTNVKTSIMLIPSSITINKDLLPKNAISYSELDLINYIYSNLDNSFEKITIYEELLSLKEQGIQTFYKLDHHWTTRAAYEAYRKYIGNDDAINLTYFYEETVTTNFRGTLYSKANKFDMEPDSIETYSIPNTQIQVKINNKNRIYNSVYFSEYLQTKDKYSYFLGGDEEIITIKNINNPNGKNILIIKDSFANCFIPFIMNNFCTTHVIDPRYYLNSISEYVKENNIDEVLILYTTYNLSSNLGIFNIQ